MTRLLCSVLTIVLAIGNAPTGNAQGQALQRVEIFQWGIYEVNRRLAPSNPPDEVEQRLDTSEFTHVRTIRTIPARIGTEFCFRFRTVGDLAVRTPLRIVTTFPSEGIIGRLSRMRIESEERDVSVLAGFPGIWCWGFDDPLDIVLGEWRIQVMAGGRKLAEQTFTIVQPGTF